MSTNKEIWYQNEQLVKGFYEKKGFTCLYSNFTIRWGELDLIVQKGKNLVIVEVKTVNAVEELDGYITPRKIQAMERTLETYLQKYDFDYDEVSFDVVFVKDGKILEQYENVTNS